MLSPFHPLPYPHPRQAQSRLGLGVSIVPKDRISRKMDEPSTGVEKPWAAWKCWAENVESLQTLNKSLWTKWSPDPLVS